MPQPIDYSGAFAQNRPDSGLLAPIQQAMQIGNMRAVREQNAQKQALLNQQLELQQLEKQEVEAGVNSYLENRDPQLLRDMMLKFPNEAERFKATLDQVGEQNKKGLISINQRLYSAIHSDRPDIAIQLANEAAEAYENKGDVQTASNFKHAAKMIENDPEAAEVTVGSMLASVLPEDKWAENIERLGGLGRGIEAKEADIAKTKAETFKAKTDQQKITQDIAFAKKKLDQYGKGVIPEEDRVKATDDLRDEYDKKSQSFINVKNAMDDLEKAAKMGTGPGDLALVFRFTNVLDDGVAVMEGDVINAKNAGGKVQRLAGLWNELSEGTSFRDEAARQKFVDVARSFYENAQSNHKKVSKGLKALAEKRKLDWEDIQTYDPYSPNGESEQDLGKSKGLIYKTPSGKQIKFSSQAAYDAFQQKIKGSN
jgi:hypothetical protein